MKKEKDCGCDETPVQDAPQRLLLSESLRSYITTLSYMILACWIVYFVVRYAEFAKKEA